MCRSFINNNLGILIRNSIARYRYSREFPDEFKQLQDKRKIITDEGYSFKPFDDNRCIFIHIPKCAGVSISKSLFGCLAGGHTTLNDYRLIFNPREFNSYYKFSIVRNPWDRLVSAYHFLMGGGFNDADKVWVNEHLLGYRDFSDFVIRGLGEEEILRWKHFKPQVEYLMINGQYLHVDFIGKMECIEKDFKIITKRLGKKSILPHANRGKKRDLNYKKFYDKKLINIVAEVYSRDINMLNYKFD